jgi:hypothetical protein
MGGINHPQMVGSPHRVSPIKHSSIPILLNLFAKYGIWFNSTQSRLKCGRVYGLVYNKPLLTILLHHIITKPHIHPYSNDNMVLRTSTLTW